MTVSYSNNPVLADPKSVRVDTLNAAFTGVPDDSVLRFTNTTVIDGQAGDLAVTHAATTGTTIEVNVPGVYMATMILSVQGAVTVEYGISLDVAAAGLTGDPVYATAGIVARGLHVGVAALDAQICLSVPLVVTNTLAAQSGTGIVRFHSTDGSNAVPAGLVLANCSAILTKVAETLA